jgi:hypothetical protein
MNLDPEIVRKIQAAAEQDAQNDFDLVQAAGLPLDTSVDVNAIDNPILCGVFARQLEAKQWRENHQ